MTPQQQNDMMRAAMKAAHIYITSADAGERERLALLDLIVETNVACAALPAPGEKPVAYRWKRTPSSDWEYNEWAAHYSERSGAIRESLFNKAKPASAPPAAGEKDD